MPYTANIIPKMTSDVAPSGVASASSLLSESYHPFHAFDHDPGITPVYERWAIAGTTGWLQYQFGAPKTVALYTLRTQNSIADGTSKAPKSWTFKGSNNGSTWDTLDTQTNVTDWGGASWNTLHTYPISNSTAYAYYRLDVSDSNSATNIVLGEMEMMGGSPVQSGRFPILSRVCRGM